MSTVQKMKETRTFGDGYVSIITHGRNQEAHIYVCEKFSKNRHVSQVIEDRLKSVEHSF